MEEQRISLFDVSINDEDVIAFGDIVYKVAKVRSAFKDLLQLNYGDFLAYLIQRNTNNFGLVNADNSMPSMYSENYQEFKYLKVGDPNWKTGGLKIYLDTFLYDQQSFIKDQFGNCLYPNLSFDDDDVISLKEDCFFKMKPIKSMFTKVSQGGFADVIHKHLSKTMAEFTNTNLFAQGKSCELMQLGSSSWETLFLGVQLTIDIVEIKPNDTEELSLDLYAQIKSPLDEIRGNIL